MRTITTIRVAIEVASGTVLTEQSSRSAAIVHAVTLLRRHRLAGRSHGIRAS